MRGSKELTGQVGAPIESAEQPVSDVVRFGHGRWKELHVVASPVESSSLACAGGSDTWP